MNTRNMSIFLSMLAMLAFLLGAAVIACDDDDDDDDLYGDDDDDNDDFTPDDDDAGDDVVEVSIINFSMTPDPVEIQVGDTVRWTNEDNVPHTATSGNPDDANTGSIFNSGTLQTGESYEFTFNTAGTFEYFCDIHPELMNGYQVIVNE